MEGGNCGSGRYSTALMMLWGEGGKGGGGGGAGGGGEGRRRGRADPWDGNEKQADRAVERVWSGAGGFFLVLVGSMGTVSRQKRIAGLGDRWPC